MSGGRRAAVGIGAVVVVVAAAVAFLLWPRGTTEISEKDAVEDFREKKSTDTTATDGQGTGTPTPGVYLGVTVAGATGAQDVYARVFTE